MPETLFLCFRIVWPVRLMVLLIQLPPALGRCDLCGSAFYFVPAQFAFAIEIAATRIAAKLVCFFPCVGWHLELLIRMIRKPTEALRTTTLDSRYYRAG